MSAHHEQAMGEPQLLAAARALEAILTARVPGQCVDRQRPGTGGDGRRASCPGGEGRRGGRSAVVSVDADTAVARAYARVLEARYPGTRWLPVEASEFDAKARAGKPVRCLAPPQDVERCLRDDEKEG